MTMETRYACHPDDVKRYDTNQLRKHFLIETLMQPGALHAVHSLYDRMVVIGVVPAGSPLALPAFPEVTKSDFFLARRELGAINVGGKGSITVDGQTYPMGPLDCLYVGKGAREVVFQSDDPAQPAMFYLNATPAHREYPVTHASLEGANQLQLGSQSQANERTIFQYIHEGGIQSCQLVMGFTRMKPGSVWNTFPPHTHVRRMEAYFYFDLPADQAVIHLMGEPAETRHLIVKNHQAIISPEWSIHSGAGTSAYAFIWGMGGENQTFADMDPAGLQVLR